MSSKLSLYPEIYVTLRFGIGKGSGWHVSIPAPKFDPDPAEHENLECPCSLHVLKFTTLDESEKSDLSLTWFPGGGGGERYGVLGLRQINTCRKVTFFKMTTFCIAFYESYISTVSSHEKWKYSRNCLQLYALQLEDNININFPAYMYTTGWKGSGAGRGWPLA